METGFGTGGYGEGPYGGIAPTSRTELLLRAVMAALKNPGLPSGVTVDRSRRAPVELKDLPRISVYPREEEIARATPNRGSPVSDRKLRVAVAVRVTGTDEALDELRQWTVASILADPSLGGLALATDEISVEWEASEDSETDYSMAVTIFVIRYQTNKKDLSKEA